MGVLRMALPVTRVAARVTPGVGRRLLGATLLRCVMPNWVLLRPSPVARRVAWAAEAVELYRSAGTEMRPDGLARALVLHGQVLLLAERYEEAIAAVDASTAVPGARPSPAQTAGALRTRAQALLDAGRAEDALAPARECVERYRGAPLPARRDRSLGGLPLALLTVALVLGRLGRVAESVAVHEECAEILRAMPVRQLGRFGLTRPRVLVELIDGLGALGRHEEALALGAEAEEALPGTVAWVSPELVHYLRVRLSTALARSRLATGRTAEARDTAEEAVAQAREGVVRHPVRGPLWLADALGCLALVLREVKAHEEELGVRRELVDLYARLAADRSTDYETYLVDALAALSAVHDALGEHAGSVAATERGVVVLRGLVERDPAAFEPHLARRLADLSIDQQNAGEVERAVATAREAVALSRRLAETDWQRYTPLTARQLRVLGAGLRRTGDHAGAVASHAEAEALLRDVVEQSDDGRHVADLDRTRLLLARALRRAATADGVADAVPALRSLLALTHRTDATAVHATCVRAFAEACEEHQDDVVREWERVTGEPYPTFVYRCTTDRGRGSKPAAR
ncbi:hypothetical protein ACIQI8_04420 [Streptomyces sp. NPDC092369]|uniref:hypothetical protein n=1 Tax=Streptomyces sp. NPDC092369 TaxID=3366015 RepID=UPI0037FA7AD8